MKIHFKIMIDAHLKRVWEVFVDMEQRAHWQQDFLAYETITGRPGHAESTSVIAIAEDNRQSKLTETITERREESFLAVTRTSDSGTSLTVHQFRKITDQQTEWSSWGNFRFQGIAKITALFKASEIKRQMHEDMQRFKLLLETDTAGASN